MAAVLWLIVKRMHHSRRNIKALLTHILLPSIFVTIAMTVALSQPKADTNPPLVLSPTMFHPPPYYIPFSNNKKGRTNMHTKMENTLNLPSGIGSDCVLKFPNMTIDKDFPVRYLRKNLDSYFTSFCAKQVGGSYVKKNFVHKRKKPVHTNKKSPKCHCKLPNWVYICEPGVGGDPDSFITVTMDTMLNISHQNIDDYLLNTNLMFKRRRYDEFSV